jgi:hypothetical protein
MELFGLFGVASYCVAALAVGTRLVLLARRTRKLPERLIGIAFLAGGGVGYPCLIAATQAAEAAPVTSRLLFLVAWSGLVAAAICLTMFWQRVYHPRRAGARALTVLLVVLLLCSLLGLLASLSDVNIADSPWYLFGLAVQGIVYALNGSSSAHYHVLLRRRMRLGLAEPVVVNRVLLWGIAAWAITVQYIYSLTYILITGHRSTSGFGTLLVSSLGLVAAGTMLLAFLAPRWYLRRIERGAAIHSSE